MSAFTPTSKRVRGVCDRCGLVYKLLSLREEVVQGVGQGNLVCPSCWDSDHPQNYVSYLNASDPQQIEKPQPPQPEKNTHPPHF